MRRTDSRSVVQFVGVLIVVVMCAWMAPVARGVDSIYWSNSTGVRVGNLAGSGTPGTVFTGEASTPLGVSIDATAGKVYWADTDAGTIRVGNLDGSGTPQTLVSGELRPLDVAVDPQAKRLYWSEESVGLHGGAIRMLNLRSRVRSPKTLYSGETNPVGIAIDPAAGKIYWGSAMCSPQTVGVVRVGNLDASGTPKDLPNTANSCPWGVAINPAAGKIYWTNAATDSISVGYLDGSGSAKTLFAGEIASNSIAIDPAAGKIYWPAFNGPSGSVRVGNLDGSGTPATLFSGESSVNYLSIGRAPMGKTLPSIVGGSTVGSVLYCSTGSWASDMPGAFLSMAPQGYAFQWSRNGSDISGATGSSYVASVPGSYACRVTATNRFGSTAQTSTAYAVQWTLFLSKTGTGQGTVTSSPAGIDCGSACEHGFPSGAVVSLTAIPAAGSRFAGWSGACSGNGTCMTAVNGDTHVNATFNAVPVLSALTVAPPRSALTGRLVRGRCVAAAKTNRVRPPCRLPIRVRISYGLTIPAVVTFTLERSVHGHRNHGRCIAVSGPARGVSLCTVSIPVRGRITHSGSAGANSFIFHGRIGGHALAGGTYRLSATPAASGLTGTPRRTTFQITK